MRRRRMWRTLVTATLLVAAGSHLAAHAAPSKKRHRALVAFETSPFPFHGVVPGKEQPFFDVEVEGRRGHTSPRGGVYWEDETYADRRVLLDIPRGFDPARPGVIVVYFHGNKSKLERDVVRKQQVPRQVAAARLNAVLVAPQFAVDALDSTAGRFYLAGHFAKFMAEAAAQLARTAGEPKLKAAFEAMPVVLVGYSGGYTAAAYAAHVGGVGDRIKAILLFDALYGDLDKFGAWIARRSSSVFFSAHGKSSREPNDKLQSQLAAAGIDVRTELPAKAFAPGSVVFQAASEDLPHADFLTKAWTDDPLRVVLSKLGPVVKPPPPPGRLRDKSRTGARPR